MNFIGATNIFKTSEKLLADIREELKHSKSKSLHNLDQQINNLENCYRELLAQLKDPDYLTELIKLKTVLEKKCNNLKSQIENSTDLIWSIDKKGHIQTINNNFAQSFKTAFGILLKEGVNVLVSLPEPLRSIWKERYDRALSGEQFTLVDQFDFEGIPQYSETSFNPIKVGDEVVGVSCFSRDITKQKSSEEQFKLLAQISPNPISIITKDGFAYVNNAWEEIFGYSSEEILNKSIELVLPESDDKTDSIQHLNNLIDTGTENIRNTTKIITKSKKEVFLDVASTPLKFDNKKALLSVSTDITELLKLQEDFKISQANLISQLNNTDARIWSIDNDIKIVNTNDNFKNDFKIAFNTDLKPGTFALEGVTEPLLSEWTKRYKKAISGEKYNIVEEFKIENIPQFVEVSFNPIRVENKIVGVSCYSRDISEQKRAEIGLKESEQRLKTLLDNLPSTTYRAALDKHWTVEFISDDIKELTGYPASDFVDNVIRSFASIIHKEDQNHVDEVIREAVKKKDSYRLEYRVLHKSGTIKWVSERGRAIYNDDNEVLWLDGVISDITSQKQAEELIKESEEQYRAIFNSMSDVFIRTNLEGNILIVTPSIIDLLGYTPEEIIGTPINELYKEPKNRKRLVSELMEKGFVRDFEAVFPTKSQGEKIISINAKLLINDSGRPYAIEGMARDITLRKMAQKSLEERTQELDSIFEHTPVILLLVDKAGHVLNVNKASSSNPLEEKAHFTKLLAGEAIKCVNTLRTKQDCGKGEACKGCLIRKTLDTTFKTKQNQNQVEGSISIIINQQKIERRYLISTAYIEFESDKRVLISLDDITDMREAEEEIRRLSVAVDQSTATIVITDKKGRIEYVNPQFEKSTGYKASEAVGKNPRILRSNDTPDAHYQKMWDTITSGKTWTGEFLNVRKDQSTYWESANISPITNRAGEITHFIAIKEDITEKKRIQEELVNSEKELREMNTEKSKYLSILAHDLRGLVGSFNAYSDLILSHYDEFDETERKEQIQNLSRVSSDSLSLLDNLLAWGKATQGQVKLDLTEINLFKNVEIVRKTLNEIATNKGIELKNTIDESIQIKSDVNILQTIIRNLVNNSIKFTSDGGHISISALQLPNSELEISVSDTGIGMDEETASKLFKLGEKVVREGTNHESGTGLGLIICKEMAQKLGGKLQVESEVGKGSRFFFNLPGKL